MGNAIFPFYPEAKPANARSQGRYQNYRHPVTVRSGQNYSGTGNKSI